MRFEFGQGIDVFQHLLPDPCKDAAAFEIRELPPVGCQRRLRGLNGCVDILRVAFGDGAEALDMGLTVAGVDVIELGKRSARQLLSQIEGAKISGITWLNTDLIVRDSS